MFTAWPSPLEGCWVPSVHAVCNHNENAALRLRSLGPTPAPVFDEIWHVQRSFLWLRRIACRYSGERWTHLQTALSYTGALRRRYLEAEESMRKDGPVGFRDVLLRSFVKAEKFNAMAKFAKPRCIFPRSPRYNLDLASRLKPFEHWLWGNLRSPRFFKVPPSRVVAKGLTPQGRANLVRRKFSNFRECVCFEVDGRAFEAHCDVWQLREEHGVYRAAFPGDRDLARLLSYQLSNRGVTGGGLCFSREGGRASGDFNTGMGNSLIFLAVVSSVMRALEIPFDVLVDGDNALVFMERVHSSLVVERFAALALRFSGHEMVLERPVTSVEAVRFGQSAPVETRCGWLMVRDWRKVLSHGTSSHVHLRDPRHGLRWLLSVSLCELSLARGVPIVGAWAESLRRATAHAKPLRLESLREYQVLGVTERSYVQACYEEPVARARESFAAAFGVTIQDQLRMERRLFSSGPDLSFRFAEVESPDADSWWFADPGLCEAFVEGGQWGQV